MPRAHHVVGVTKETLVIKKPKYNACDFCFCRRCNEKIG